MKLIKLIFLLAFLFISKVSLADNAHAQLDALLSNFKSMSADFTQVATVKKSAAKKSMGTMALQRPGKFRWEITSPNHQTIIADSKNLWIYDVDLEQATKRSLAKDAHSPAMLLSGSTAALEQRFNIIDYQAKGNQAHFILKPKQNQDMLDKVELHFKDNKLDRMAVIDNLGQKNTFYFDHVKVNPSLSNALFKFHAPKGTDIIQE